MAEKSVSGGQMILLIDIGNTRFKYSLFISPIVHEKNIAEHLGEINSELNEYLTEDWLNQHAKQVKQIIFANVSDEIYTAIIERWCQVKYIESVHVTTEQSRNGVENGYQNYQQLGVDRWLALLGSRSLYANTPCLIIDSGTATTFDVLSRDGQHIGGWILPGVEVMANSVFSSTARVKDSLVNIDNLAFGKTTAENLMQASWAATLGAIHQAISLIDKSHTETFKIIFTGGNGKKLHKYFNLQQVAANSVVEPKLIFNGLLCYISK